MNSNPQVAPGWYQLHNLSSLCFLSGGRIHFINLKEQFLPLRNWLKKKSSKSSMNGDWFTPGAPTNGKVDLLWNGDDDENFIHGR